jgi:hypothetical protein
MSLFDNIIAVYPELTNDDFDSFTGSILLRNDSDGEGDYIAKWEYSKPLPNGMKVGKN